MRLLFTGSAGGSPAPWANLTAVLVGDILLDCGYGTSRLLIAAGVLDRVNTVAITHFHGDHFGGVPALLWDMLLYGRYKPLMLIGPRGLREAVVSSLACVSKTLDDLSFDVEIVEVEPGEEHPPITVGEAKHSVKPSLSYRLDLPGLSMLYTGDTMPTEQLERLAGGCSVIVHEASYPAGMEEEARADGHSTVKDAAELAERVGARALFLVHLPYFRLRDPSLPERFKAEAKRYYGGRVIVPGNMEEFEV